jgi:WD40 repeat protein
MKGRGKSSLPTRSTKSLELKEIAGNTCTHNRHFAHSPQGRVVAYAAASTVVLYNYLTKEQTVLAAGAGDKDVKMVSCLSFSWDGKYLAVGRCGHLPTVGVYDVANGVLSSRSLLHLSSHSPFLSLSTSSILSLSTSSCLCVPPCWNGFYNLKIPFFYLFP